MNIDNDTLEFTHTDPISCMVSRKQLTFQIIGLSDDPLYVGFIVRFSDGVQFETGGKPSLLTDELNDPEEQVSAVDESEGEDYTVHNSKYVPYLKAIKYHLEDFVSIMNTQWYQFLIKIKSEKRVVWVAYHEAYAFPYTVHYFGDYQFSLKKEDGIWESTSVRVMDSRTIDAEIVTLVTRQPDKRTLN